MRVAVIGGTRFIGAAAVRHLLRRNHEVVVLHRGEHPNPNAGARVVPVDRADATALGEAIRSAAADAIVDTRSMTGHDADIVTAALRDAALPLITLSSQDVYAQFGAILGHPAPAPEATISEQSPLTIPFPYRHLAGQHGHPDYDKKEVEQRFKEAVQTGDLDAVTVLRLPATFGKGDPARRFGAIVDALDDGDGSLPCIDGGRWKWTHSHVDDVAHAIALATEQVHAGFEIFNVGDEHTPSMGEWARRFAHYMGKALRWVESPGELPDGLHHLGRIAPNVVVDSGRIRRDLGFAETTDVASKVASIVDWAREARNRPA